jgi:hypothetical protein
MRGKSISGGLVISRPSLLVAKPTKSVIGITLMSDLHIGANNVDYKKIKSDIDEAVANGDRILVNGDVFDGIICHDRRFTPDVLHPRLQGKRDVLNRAVDWGVELFAGAENNIDMVGCGNHEEHVTKFGGIDILQVFVHELNRKVTKKDHRINVGGYSGFVDYRIKWITSADGGKKPNNHRVVIYYHHGSGGGSAASGGALTLYKKRVFIADVHWLGHIHTKTTRCFMTCEASTSGSLIMKEVKQIVTASYMDTYGVQTQASYKKHGRISNYAADLGMPPEPKGCSRLLLRFRGSDEPDEKTPTGVSRPLWASETRHR